VPEQDNGAGTALHLPVNQNSAPLGAPLSVSEAEMAQVRRDLAALIKKAAYCKLPQDEKDEEHDLSARFLIYNTQKIQSAAQARGATGIVLGEEHSFAMHNMQQTCVALVQKQNLGLEVPVNVQALIFDSWLYEKDLSVGISARALQGAQTYLRETRALDPTAFMLGYEATINATKTNQFQSLMLSRAGLDVLFNDAAMDAYRKLSPEDPDTLAALWAVRRPKQEGHYGIDGSDQDGMAARNHYMLGAMGAVQQVGCAHSFGDALRPNSPYALSMGAMAQAQGKNLLFPMMFDDNWPKDGVMAPQALSHPGFLDLGHFNHRAFKGEDEWRLFAGRVIDQVPYAQEDEDNAGIMAAFCTAMHIDLKMPGGQTQDELLTAFTEAKAANKARVEEDFQACLAHLRSKNLLAPGR
ncbi:MAG: hypothetical protein AAF204_05555, partial [Pseudomonadota bacterium]